MVKSWEKTQQFLPAAQLILFESTAQFDHKRNFGRKARNLLLFDIFFTISADFGRILFQVAYHATHHIKTVDCILVPHSYTIGRIEASP